MKKAFVFLASFAIALGVMAVDYTPVTEEKGQPVQADSATNTAATAYTPVFAGQVLTGQTGDGTNSVWIAVGTTTNDWVKVSAE